MKKITALITASVILAASNAAQSAQPPKSVSPTETLLLSCVTLQKTWEINAKNLESSPSHDEDLMNTHCAATLNTTITLAKFAKDSKLFSNICIPTGETEKDILTKTLPTLINQLGESKILDSVPPLALLAALEPTYPCAETNL